MVKRRKLRSSQPQPEPEREPEQQQPPQPEEEEGQHEQQPQIEQLEQQGVVVEEDQIEEQQANEDVEVEDMEEAPADEQQDEEEEEEEVHHMEEDQEKEAAGETVTTITTTTTTTTTTSSSVEVDVAAAAEANGGEENGGGGGEEEEEELEEEPVEKVLEPFSKEQLLLLLKEAVSKHPDFVESVEKIADSDPSRRKIFVHGLGWDTNTETLTGVFGKYGEIEDCKAVTDKVSGKSKGYGFILFKNRSGARKALKQPQKMIGTRMTSCQLASAGPVPAPPPTAPPVSEFTQRKIFVSNVSADIDPQKLLEYFAKFGEIEDGPLGLDRQTGKPKGFALFVYKTIDGAKKALEEPHKNYEGHMLHCQKAIDGPKQNKPFYQQQQQQHQHSSSYGRKDYNKPKYHQGGGGGGHLMAPSGSSMGGFNPAAVAPALTPALGQALTALLATQGAGLGITNLLGGLGASGASVVNQGMPPMMNNAAGYANQGGGGGGGYGNQPVMQGGYQNPQIGQGGPGRSQPGGAPYTGPGH